MRAYLSLFRLRVITNLQYRAEALAGLATQFFFGFVYIMVYLAFYKSNGSSPTPMEWSNLVSYVWLNQAFLTLTHPFETSENFAKLIKNGNLAYELIRPRSLFLKEYISLVAKKFTECLLRFPPVLIVALFLPKTYRLLLPNSIPAFISFVITLILAGLLVSVLTVIVQILTMFTIDEKGISQFYRVSAEIFMGSVVPIAFFPNWLKAIANVLPFRYMVDIPFRLYTGDIAISQAPSLILGSLIWIIVGLIIGSILTKIALKKAVIQGG